MRSISPQSGRCAPCWGLRASSLGRRLPALGRSVLAIAITLIISAQQVRAQSETAQTTAKTVAGLLGGSSADRARMMSLLASESDLDRFETLRILDRTDGTTVRKVYDALDASGRNQLLSLTKSAGDAGTRAGLQEVGIVSDNDDTAFPTNYTPNGPYAFKGSAAFYKLVAFGTDGKGDPANVHYVSARIPLFFGDSRMRLEAAGLPDGTFDGDTSVLRFIFGGLNGIQKSKIENIDLWIKLHPGQRFVFLGDSLQRDPEVYKWVLENHPEAVEAVLIHKAGGPARNPADYKGMIFFDDYTQAAEIVRDRGIVQPGAKLPEKAPDLADLPLPNTDVSKINAAEAARPWYDKVADGFSHFFEENVFSLWHRPKGVSAAKPEDARDDASDVRGARTSGMTEYLKGRIEGEIDPEKKASEE